MTIAEAREKCKATLGQVPRDLLIVGVLILASSASFGLGFLAGRDAGQGSERTLGTAPLIAPATTGTIVAAKGGTKYYLPSCAGASRISDANKIWFASPAAAEAAGYSAAANCSGL
jgi:hypothetical protein